MKTENLTVEEATEIIQRGGVVEDRDGDRYGKYTLHPAHSAYTPFRVVTPPPDAEPVVTAEELLMELKRRDDSGGTAWYVRGLEDVIRYLQGAQELKAARAPKLEPPPDAEPVVTAEELTRALKGLLCNGCFAEAQDQLDALKAARAPKPEPQPIRTLAEALACERLRLVDTDGDETYLVCDTGWTRHRVAFINGFIESFDADCRVYDATEKEQAK